MPPLCKEHKAMGGVFSLVKRMSTEICLTGIVERCNEMNTQRQHWAGIRFSSRLYSQNTLRDHRVCYTCKCGSQIEPHVLNSMRSVVCISLYSPSAACNVTSMHLTELPCKHVGCCLHYMQYNLTAQSQHMHHIWLALQWWLRFFRGGHPFALFHSSI